MERTAKEIIRDFNETQTAYDKLLYEIGLLTAQSQLSNNSNLTTTINDKVKAFQKVELRLREIEKELSNIKP